MRTVRRLAVAAILLAESLAAQSVQVADVVWAAKTNPTNGHSYYVTRRGKRASVVQVNAAGVEVARTELPYIPDPPLICGGTDSYTSVALGAGTDQRFAVTSGNSCSPFNDSNDIYGGSLDSPAGELQSGQRGVKNVVGIVNGRAYGTLRTGAEQRSDPVSFSAGPPIRVPGMFSARMTTVFDLNGRTVYSGVGSGVGTFFASEGVQLPNPIPRFAGGTSETKASSVNGSFHAFLAQLTTSSPVRTYMLDYVTGNVFAFDAPDMSVRAVSETGWIFGDAWAANPFLYGNRILTARDLCIAQGLTCDWAAETVGFSEFLDSRTGQMFATVAFANGYSAGVLGRAIYSPSTVPEPRSLLLFAAGAVAVLRHSRRRETTAAKARNRVEN
jgi:hypothetical protein